MTTQKFPITVAIAALIFLDTFLPRTLVAQQVGEYVCPYPQSASEMRTRCEYIAAALSMLELWQQRNAQSEEVEGDAIGQIRMWTPVVSDCLRGDSIQCEKEDIGRSECLSPAMDFSRIATGYPDAENDCVGFFPDDSSWCMRWIGKIYQEAFIYLGTKLQRSIVLRLNALELEF